MTSKRWRIRLAALAAGVLAVGNASAPASSPDLLRVDDYASCAGNDQTQRAVSRQPLAAAAGRTL
jgi:hypothetical protein